MDESQTPKPTKEYDKKVHGKRYPITNKVAIMALKDASLSVRQVARLAHVSERQVYRVWNDPEINDLVPDVVSKVKKGLGGLFYKRSLEATLSIDQEKLDESSALQLATVAGIMTEKGRLMEGLSTENVSHRGVIENLDSERVEIMKRIQNLSTSDGNKP